jgi:predicted DNA-binding ribbon-helix-helix protein
MQIRCKQHNFSSELQIRCRTHNLAVNTNSLQQLNFTSEFQIQCRQYNFGFTTEHTIQELMLIRCKQLNFDSELQIHCRQYNFGRRKRIEACRWTCSCYWQTLGRGKVTFSLFLYLYFTLNEVGCLGLV